MAEEFSVADELVVELVINRAEEFEKAREELQWAEKFYQVTRDPRADGFHYALMVLNSLKGYVDDHAEDFGLEGE